MKVEIPIDGENSKLVIVEEFLSEDFCNELNQEITQIELIKNPLIFIRGRECVMHRNVGFVTDACSEYAYSGQQMKAVPLNDKPCLIKCLDLVNQFAKGLKLKAKFNGILINQYMNGEDYIGAHSDNETNLANHDVVAISLGASRIFRVREKSTKAKIYDLETQNGQLLCMMGDFQSRYTHEVPIQKKVKEMRTSLTFRVHL